MRLWILEHTLIKLFMQKTNICPGPTKHPRDSHTTGSRLEEVLLGSPGKERQEPAHPL